MRSVQDWRLEGLRGEHEEAVRQLAKLQRQFAKQNQRARRLALVLARTRDKLRRAAAAVETAADAMMQGGVP